MMLECKELTKWFGSREAVADLTLNLDKGKIYGLLGENGSGKTTWMKMVAGLTKPGRGEIIYQGHPLDYTDKGNITKRFLKISTGRSMKICWGRWGFPRN